MRCYLISEFHFYYNLSPNDLIYAMNEDEWRIDYLCQIEENLSNSIKPWTRKIFEECELMQEITYSKMYFQEKVNQTI